MTKRKSLTSLEQDNKVFKKSARRTRRSDTPPRPDSTEHLSEFQQVSLSDLDRWRVQLGYGADVYYNPDFIPPNEANEWYDTLNDLETYQPTLKVYGKNVTQSRHIAAYATEPGMQLKYSGTFVDMHHPFPPCLERMRERVEAVLGVKFNHCMLNRYEDGAVYIGQHSDTKENLVIAAVSVGAERTFIMTPRKPSRAKAGSAVRKQDESSPATTDELARRKSVKWKLGNGSLVVMQGRTQEFWKHEIPREPGVKTGRISLTFRQLVGNQQ